MRSAKGYSPELKKYAQGMRSNMTKEERRLWFDFLKSLPVTVKRQQVFGKYIVDFYIASANLVIELDGSQHYEPEGKEYDEARDDFLRKQGVTVLRYSNTDINQRFRAVCEDILTRL